MLIFFSSLFLPFSGQSGQEMTETQNISMLFVVVRSAGRKGHEWLDAHAVSMFTCWLLCLAQSLSVEHVMREIFRILICTSSSDKAEKRNVAVGSRHTTYIWASYASHAREHNIQFPSFTSIQAITHKHELRSEMNFRRRFNNARIINERNRVLPMVGIHATSVENCRKKFIKLISGFNFEHMLRHNFWALTLSNISIKSHSKKKKKMCRYKNQLNVFAQHSVGFINRRFKIPH